MAEEKTFTQADIDSAVEKAVGKVQESLDKLETKNSELLDEAKKAKAELRKVKEISPDDVAAIEAERDKALVDLAAANKAAKDAVVAAEKATKALTDEQGFTQRLLIQDGLKAALIENGVKDADYIDTLSAKFAQGAAIAVDGDKRVAKVGDKSLSEYIKEWAATDAGKKFVEAPVNSGGGAGGAKPAGGGKTITRDVFNGMDQGARGAFFKDGGQVVDA